MPRYRLPVPDRSDSLTTSVCALDDASLALAVELIRAGHPIAVPTETVYGLAADATNGSAVAAIYAAKGRPTFNPLIVHVDSIEMARKLICLSPVAETLAQAFWPGPLTMVLPKAQNCPVSDLASAGLTTLAVRFPAHPAMLALIKASGVPLAAPSANKSGAVSPTNARHVLESLAGRVALVLDAGATTDGLESTIVAVHQGGVSLLRPGPITTEALEAVIGQTMMIAGQGGGIIAPGQLESHYAPRKPLLLNQMSASPDVFHIGFGECAGQRNLSVSRDLKEAAANLFAALHEADASACARISVAPIPMEGIGAAINDRLRRAAA